VSPLQILVIPIIAQVIENIQGSVKMAKYRYVHVEFWQDPKVLEEMTPEDKYFYLYLLTNPSTTQIGVYKITKKQMAFDLGYSIESINSLLERFINVHKVIKYNEKTRELAVIHWGKYNLNKAGKPVLDCIKKELAEVKDKTLLWEIMNHIPNELVTNEFSRHVYDTSNDTYHDTSTASGQKEKEKEKEKEKTTVAENPFDFYQQNFGVLNPFIGQSIGEWVDDLNEELVIEAMKITLKQQKNWKYCEGILKDWRNKNIRSVEDMSIYEKGFKQKSQPKPPREEKESILAGFWGDDD
jgi:DnaD/phage-associated family protein